MRLSYEDVLVLCAPQGSPTPSCSHYLQSLQALGAMVQFSVCYAEVSLTRCVQAAAAYQTLQKYPRLRWVFWVDADMCSSPDALEMLIMTAEKVQSVQGGDSLAPTVSGAYINRHDIRRSTRLSAYAVRGAFATDIELPHPRGGQLLRLSITPALVGMGCLLQSRQVFMLHCDEAEHFCYPSEEFLVPQVCQSYRVHCSELAEYIDLDASKDQWFWNNEDFDYSIRELFHSRLVYLVDVPFGHEFMQVSYPNPDTMFPGLKPPTTMEPKRPLGPQCNCERSHPSEGHDDGCPMRRGEKSFDKRA